MKTSHWMLLVCLLSLAACQREDSSPFESSGAGQPGGSSSGGVSIPLVANANGTLSIPCLQSEASAIQQNGASAMAACQVNSQSVASMSSTQRATMSLQKHPDGYYYGYYADLRYYGFGNDVFKYLFGTNCWDSNWYNTLFGYSNAYNYYYNYYSSACSLWWGNCYSTYHF